MFARTDPRPILHSFFAEFHEKLPSVCGRKLQFVTKAKYHTAGFLSVYEVTVLVDQLFIREQRGRQGWKEGKKESQGFIMTSTTIHN